MPDTNNDAISAVIPLSGSLNVNSIDQDKYVPGSVAPFNKNNGLVKDGGITELYEISETVSGATEVYIASNGRRLKLKNLGASSYATDIIVTDDKGVDSTLGQTSSVFFNRQLISRAYYDVALSSDNVHALGIWADETGLSIDEFALDGNAITHTAQISTTYTALNIYNAVIARANTLTYATAQSTSGFVVCSSASANQYVYIRNSTAYTNSLAGSVTIAAQADALIAFYNAGTVVWQAYIGGAPKIYKLASPYSTPAVVQGSGSIDGCSMGTRYSQGLAAAQTTLKLIASTTNATTPTFQINIDGSGAVTVASDAGNTYPTATGTFVATQMTCTPYGAAGKQTQTGTGAGYYSWVCGSMAANSTLSVDNTGMTQPELLAPITMTVGSVTFAIEVKSYNRIPSLLTARQLTGVSTKNGTGTLINDPGGGLYGSDIMSGYCDVASYNPVALFWPFDYRSETVSGNGAWIVYKRNDRRFVLVKFTYNAGYRFTEIGPGIVSLNCCLSSKSIIDTNTIQAYDDCSGYVNAFTMSYTAAATSLAFFKKFNRYSSSLDAGLMYIDTGTLASPASGQHISCLGGTYYYYANDFTMYDVNGGYLFNLSQDIGYSNSLYFGTYVNSTYVSPGKDAIFTNGGIQMLAVSAMGQPSYMGYQLANLFPVRYQSFFILKGNYYAFDGSWVYTIPFPNGPSSALTGPVLPVVVAQGLTYLDCSPNDAFFLSSYDNSIWTFSGGRAISKVAALNKKPAIISGTFNTRDNALVLVTANSIITIWDGSTITENALPFSPASSFVVNNSSKELYFVQGSALKSRSYSSTAPSGATATIIPLDWQSAFYGFADEQSMSLTRVVGKVYCGGGIPIEIDLTWHYIESDGSDDGAVTASVTPAAISTSDYFMFDWNPPSNFCLAGSLEVATTDATQKIVIVEIVLYLKADSQATVINHAA